MMATTPDALVYIFNHLFLPPQLPQQDDYKAQLEKSLISTTIDGLIAWRHCIDPSRHEQADVAISTIRNMQRVYSAVDGSLDETVVFRLLTQLTENAAIPLYIREQNAGVLISKHNRRVNFDVFEISPQNQATMTTRGRLRRSFPGASVLLDESHYQQHQFQETIAHTLAHMSRHPVKAMQPQVKKAGSILHEDRDTNHPGMVSEVLIGFLRSVGEAVECPIISKNMRDDVLWDDARSPWRRSPAWLLVRVALQLGFGRNPTSTTSDQVYKEAMLYILAHTLTLATEQSLPSDVLSSMSAKLARRRLKIGPALDDGVLLYVQGAMKSAHMKLDERWSIVQKQDAPVIAATELSGLNFISDCYVAIPELDSHIGWMGNREQEQIPGSFQPPSTLMTLSPRILPPLPQNFTNESKSDAIVNLEAFETWVTLHCREWIWDNKGTSCDALSSLIATYHNLALKHYLRNPEALSAMVLTIFELWVACDDAAVNLCPLLKEYDPSVPRDILQNLLLPFASQMERLHHVEKYLASRSSSAKFPSTSLYHDLENSDCFPVRYFDGSTELQETHKEIIEKARVEKQEKLDELHDLQMEYIRLMAKYSRLECEYVDVLVDRTNNFYESRHNPSCAKCGYADEAKGLRIDIHEWPLPQSITKAKSIIFELCIPPFFQSWRQATFYVLRDVIGMEYSEKSTARSLHSLAEDPHLPKHSSYSSHIGLLSEEKPQVVTHRHGPLVSTATEESVCVNNGLKYRYFDFKLNQFVETFTPTEEILKMCTYHLPWRSKSLEKYLFRPASLPDGPGSNVALADQSETPMHMSVEETRDLATLPLGHHIQLHNILVQLAAPSLDFRKDETTIFVLQCLYQSGPPSDTKLRASHAVTTDEAFAFSLLENVTAAWQRVKDNWESAQALSVFAAATARLLSLTSSDEVKQRCLKFLSTLRTGGFAWVELLRDKSHKATEQDDRAFFKAKSVDVALICASCFDVEECHLSEILKSDIDASIFVQCSILIQEGKPAHNPDSELTLACLSLRFHRLLYRSLPILSTTHSGISDAIQKSWSAYRPGGEWRLAHNTAHWLVTEMASGEKGDQFQVHYNLLSGELLVNGIPLSRPPREYEDHPMWCVLFGRTAVEVMPTSAAAMKFSAKRQYKGYDVRFGMKRTSSGGSDLLVQASCSNIDYETIPNRLLKGMFPDHFVNNFVLWYNHKEEILEFRPMATPWNSEDPMWVLSRYPRGWTLAKNGSTVLGANSRTATAIAKVLLPLADKCDIHVVLQPSDGSLVEVELPAIQLGFFLTAGKSALRSREFPGMSIDNDQSLGTLTGFANKMILTNGTRRLVLVPEGPVSWTSTNNRIRVTVSKSSITKVHALYVDSVLGRLTDNGNLQGKLFLSYLHGLTSHCLPDPLTMRTGVEQALSILNSAAVRSFDRLSQQNIDILVRIAKLCPQRKYYPENEQVMQRVTWRPDLSCLSHHDGFYKAVGVLFEQARQMSLFYPDLYSEKLDLREYIDTDEFLLDRDRIRTSTFRISGFGAEEHTTAYDVTYCGRDRHQASDRGTNAYVLSSMLYQERTTLHTNALLGGELWTIMSLESEILGPDQNVHVSQLRYSDEAANSGLDLSRWLALHKALSARPAEGNKFSLMMWLSAIAAHEQADMRLLQILALFFTHHELRDVKLPSIELCHPKKGYEATTQHLKNTVGSHLQGFSRSPEAEMQAYRREGWSSFQSRRDREYNANKDRAVNTLAELLRSFWPRETLPTLNDMDLGGDRRVSNYVRLMSIEFTVRRQFEEWFANLRLFEYLQRIEDVLSDLGHRPLSLNQPALVTLAPPVRTRTFVSVRDLFAGAALTLPTALSVLELESSNIRYDERTPRLPGLIDDLRKTNAQSQYGLSYIEELQASMRSWQEQKTATYPNLRYEYPIRFLRQHLDDCERTMKELYSRLCLATGGADAQNGASELGHSPRLSPLLFLQQLSKGAWKLLSLDWRVSITRYGLALSALQRAERLVRAASSGNDEDLSNELQNIGHRTWDPLEHPEWLLLEVESSIMIRDVQEQIAAEMVAPRCKRSAVLQLNMGEGKSSVIVPMVAAELANGSQLARVIVAKPQSKQMAQMLISKLGGLLDRRVYFMPFSRALKVDLTALANTIDTMLRDCQNSGGVLLVQPEHILSLQLMGIECYCDENTGRQASGVLFTRLQDFFDNTSRDIVDESDENFSPKFELIYTMGSQRPIELSPARWICMQHVLSLVRSLATDIAGELPKSIEIALQEKGGFPRVRILKSDAGELLVKRIARRICDSGLDGFPIARQQQPVREAVFEYITQYNLSPEQISAVEDAGNGGFWTESTKPLLLLLRGILAGGVLVFALSRKRWRVDFGLAHDRTPPTKLAVPYRAKDNPTPRSEFSHPDIVIALTSLTYYYGGLEDEDLFIALGHLMESDQASIEYDAWIKDSSNMPTSFRQLEGLNLKDRPQCINAVFPHLRYGKSVVDYFLGHVVFPKEVKEFPYKLSASGWDIGKRKAHYTTGFSGTNDSRKVLPLDIKNLDLPSQSHTNALVLEHLLQPENSVTLLPERSALSVTSAQLFLDTVVNFEKPIRVILDVGAQILELNNRQVAQKWLQMVTDTKTQAAVFINDDDELTVIDRRGRMELLQTSSYATRLDACLVFLDEAHTRGIDLKLPSDYRAAVTLGANLPKDRLVQACMRLRKLGRGQSVVFCVTAEIRDKIQRVTAMQSSATITVKDVLHWAISETFAETERSMPLWAAQGSRFLRHEEHRQSVQVNGATSMSNTSAVKFLDNEAQSIEVRYGPRTEKATSIAGLLGTETQRLDEIKERCSEFAYLNFDSSTLEEEQERELSPEVEQEREVQRPDPARPADHDLHRDVGHFVNTGNLRPKSLAYMPAFHSLNDTSAAEYFEARQLSSAEFFVTADFAQTVDASGVNHVSDSYLRPVQWILSHCAEGSKVVDKLMIISPYEAEKLMTTLQSSRSDRVALHLYRPRCLTGHQSFDKLDFFSIPALQQQLEVPRALRVQLNLFAGQLYFDTYEDYLDTCEFLGLAADVPREGEVVAVDGYILQDRNGKSKFDKSPIQFLQVLTSKIRRNGQSISKTHVGSMLEGKLLQRSDFEDFEE
ncbi:hypothetical protein F5Y14DRAFT_264197 [Nemania sp. NC0429]|nr:hypothetical protein F5Y14DRAFT_264197 [Nemania sp. NC0429]